MHTIKSIFSNLDWSYLTDMLLAIISALICISFHEMSHGLASYLLGDKTAKNLKRVSLNPLRHIDPVGLLMLIVFKFGWAKPVSIDMRNFKKPKRDMAITALAGPVSNIILACFLLFVMGFIFMPLYKSGFGRTVYKLLDMTSVLSVYLGIFNLIPIPPLDGSKVLFSFLSDTAYSKLMLYERYGMILLVALMVTGVINGPLYSAFKFIYDKLLIFTIGGFKLYEMIFNPF